MTRLISTVFCALVLSGVFAEDDQKPSLAELRSGIERLRKQVAEIEEVVAARCMPKRGTPRATVEQEFGAGKALWLRPLKTRQGEPPADSPKRVYVVRGKAQLIVWYDAQWCVQRAHYPTVSVLGRCTLDERHGLLTMREGLQQRVAGLKEVVELFADPTTETDPENGNTQPSGGR